MPKKKNPGDSSGSGERQLRTRLKTAKGRTVSSTKWLERQLNDPYITRAKREGYRSRAAYKLLEIDDKFHFLTKGKTVVDLGAAPGGWTQVAVRRIKAGEKGGGKVIGIDLQEIESIAHSTLLVGDFLEESDFNELEALLEGRAVDIVLSDMATAACGHPQTDHIRIMALCEAALEFALQHLAPNGTFVVKVLRGGAENDMIRQVKQYFKSVKHFKPPASRSDSAEMYMVATGFKNG